MPTFSPHQDAALAAVADWLRGKPGQGTPQVFRLFGYAGTGKTTLANRLAVALGGQTSGGAGSFRPDAPLALDVPVQILHGDDMYEGWGGLATLDDVLLGDILRPLAAGQDAEFRQWDWVLDARTVTIPVPQRPWLIVEGVGVGLPEARELAVLTVFIEAPWDVRLERGIERDLLAYDDVVERWTEFEADERALHERSGTREAADFRIDGTLPIPDELQR